MIDPARLGAPTAAAPSEDAIAEPVTPSRSRRNPAALTLCLLWFLPINFAVFEGPIRTAYMGLLAAAVICALIQLARADGVVAVVLGTVSVFLAVQLLSGISLQFTALLLAQLLAGIGLQRTMRGAVAVPMFLAVCTAVSLVVDQLVHDHVYMSLFASQIFSARLDEGFRARGLIGQPVPAAHLMACLLAYLWVATSALTSSRRAAARLSIIAMAAATLYTTGTRSALITAAGCIVLIAVERRLAGSRLSPVGLVRAVFVGLVVFVTAVLLLGDTLSESRLLSFDTLEGTDSLTVRSAGLDFVAGLPGNCLSCVVVGHGQGTLQEQVRASSIVSGVSTLDNQYLSAYWDFGVVGLLALLGVGMFALRRLFRSTELSVRAGAVGILGALAAGAFYDTLYLSTGAILVGFLLAAMTRAPVRHLAAAADGVPATAGDHPPGCPPLPDPRRRHGPVPVPTLTPSR